jgi:hypothetical protein
MLGVNMPVVVEALLCISGHELPHAGEPGRCVRLSLIGSGGDVPTADNLFEESSA